jgi:hypothetical protein
MFYILVSLTVPCQEGHIGLQRRSDVQSCTGLRVGEGVELESKKIYIYIKKETHLMETLMLRLE